MKKTTIFFPFEPVPKGRPRFTRSGHSYTPKSTLEYENKLRMYYRSQTNDFYDGAIKVRLEFNMPISKSTSKKNRELMVTGVIKCTKHTGDADNLAKAVLDSCNGVAFEDDCLVTKLIVIKKYATDGNVGVLMEISEDVE